jgi:hypothetical protein
MPAYWESPSQHCLCRHFIPPHKWLLTISQSQLGYQNPRTSCPNLKSFPHNFTMNAVIGLAGKECCGEEYNDGIYYSPVSWSPLQPLIGRNTVTTQRAAARE